MLCNLYIKKWCIFVYINMLNQFKYHLTYTYMHMSHETPWTCAFCLHMPVKNKFTFQNKKKVWSRVNYAMDMKLRLGTMWTMISCLLCWAIMRKDNLHVNDDFLSITRNVVEEKENMQKHIFHFLGKKESLIK